MDSWGTVLVVAVPVIVTAFSLLVQQRGANRLEGKRLDVRAQERDHELALANAERRADREAAEAEYGRAISQALREERRQAHARLLNLMHSAHEDLTPVMRPALDGEPSDAIPVPAGWEATEDWVTVLGGALTDVELISDQEASEAAEAAVEALTKIDLSVSSGKPDLMIKARLKDLHQQYHDRRKEYVVKARQDIAR
jgi:hypothetical protein